MLLIPTAKYSSVDAFLDFKEERQKERKRGRERDCYPP